jgi:hypothetical protein
MGRASWSSDGRIFYADGSSGIQEVSAQGGDISPSLETWEGVQDLHQPSALPDGRGVVFVAHRVRSGPDTIVVQSGTERKEILQIAGEGLLGPVYASSGHILYHRRTGNPGIWALPFSLSRLEQTGEPFPVTSRGMLPSVSNDGTLVHVHANALARRSLVWLDDTGESIVAINDPQEGMQGPSVSPDGYRIAITSREAESRDIWIHDTRRGTKTRLTFGPVDVYAPAWSADGTDLYYASADDEIFAKQADGGGTAKLITSGRQPQPSRDGKHLLFTRIGQAADDIWHLPLEDGAEPRTLFATDADEDHPQLSPDGRYLAYESNESGRDEIFLTRFPDVSGKWQVSAKGGRSPRWSADGNELFFAADQEMMAVRISTDGPSPDLDLPRAVFPTPSGLLVFLNYDVAPDGRFVMVSEELNAEEEKGGILVVQSWYAEFSKSPGQ